MNDVVASSTILAIQLVLEIMLIIWFKKRCDRWVEESTTWEFPATILGIFSLLVASLAAQAIIVW